MVKDTRHLKTHLESSTDRKYQIVFTSSFKQAWNKYSKSGKYDFDEINYVLLILYSGKELDQVYKDHVLKANWAGYRECHIQGDLLLIYSIEDDILKLARLGTHSELLNR